MMELLPGDLHVNILGRLPPCGLAASRCVIDTRRLLRADLLPLRLDGFFCLSMLPDPQGHFFARRCTARRVGGGLDFVDEFDRPGILDHCNGLLLLWELVVNPATRHCVLLPPYPEPRVAMDGLYERRFLACDPMVSPHFEVVSVPFLRGARSNTATDDSEWPLVSYTTHIFSSRKWMWEERPFVREGDAAGTCAEMQSDWTTRDCHAVYWRGALYVHCQDYSFMRITLSNDKYQTIKSPAESNQGVFYLGKSEKGVCSALLWKDNELPGCRVWFLNEPCGHKEWFLKNDISLQVLAEVFPFEKERYSRPWIVNYEDDTNGACEEDDSEWDFDSGVVLHETKGKAAISARGDVAFLGFHPYKEIAVFLVSRLRVVSYHLSSSKVQELGILNVQPIAKSFPYTPFWMDELFENN